MKLSLFYIIIFLFYVNHFGAQNGKYELESVSFVGNSSFSNAELLRVISLRESPNSVSQYLNDLIGLGEEAIYFDSLSLHEEVYRLKSFYFNKGYFDARISSTYFLDSDSWEAYVVFEIIEGRENKIHKVKVNGLEKIEKQFQWHIRDISKIDTSEQYSYSRIKEINAGITKFLRDNGYMFAKSDSTIIYIDTVSNKVDAQLFFSHGTEYTISEIIVKKEGEGKDEVETELIRDIAGLQENEKYNESEIRLSQSRLYKTNLFNLASVNTINEDTVGNLVPIRIGTEIGSMYELSPEVIANNEDNRFNLGLSLGFSKKNFIGDARILTLSGSIASQNIFEFVRNMSVSDTSVIGYADMRLILEQPFLFGKNIGTRAEAYSTLQKRKNEYNTTASGVKFGLNFELPEFVYLTSLNSSWNFENLKILYQKSYLYNLFKKYIEDIFDQGTEQNDSLAAIIAEQIGKETNSNNTLLSFNFGLNKTNDFTFPTNGFKTNLLIGNANAIPLLISKIFNKKTNSALYYKTQLDFSVFPSIYFSNENAFGIKFRVGYINVYDGLESAVPYNQRFTAGGSNSVRGWQSRELVPVFSLGNIDYTSIPPADLRSILLNQAAPGGLFLLEGSVETRNRLIGDLGGALFLDYGNSWANAKVFRYDEIAVSTGFGFRYYTDFIPFRLDFGIKLYDPISGIPVMKQRFWIDTLQIHFAIGEAF